MTMTPEAPAKTLTQLVATEIKLEMVRQDDVKQSQLARKIGKTEQWLSVRLRGRQPIDVNDLALIAHGLGVPVHRLLPDPETASTAKVGGPILWYAQPTVRTSTRPSTRAVRPPNTRPPGQDTAHHSTDRPTTVRRTARVARTDRT